MPNSPLRYDLFDAIRAGSKQRLPILGFAAGCALIAAVYFFLQKNTYRAYGSFFPASAVISGRINLMRETNQDWIDYFGGENEVDRATVIAHSADVISFLIDSFKIADHYKIDVRNDKDGNQKVYKKFMKNFAVTRSGFKHIEVTFIDEDHDLAYRVVNAAILRTEEILRKLYIRINNELATAIENRADSISNHIAQHTDSLVSMRVRYGIYDLISPGRKTMLNFSPKGSGAQYAEGLEQIQSLEELKDRLVTDRARYISLANEFRTATYDGFPMVHVTQWATPFGPKAGPFRILGVLTVFGITALFGLLLSLIADIYGKQKGSDLP